MRFRTWFYRSLFFLPILLGVFLLLQEIPGAPLSASGRPSRFDGPTQSGPVAVTDDDQFVWVVNPDNDLVTLIDVGGDLNRVVARIPVGDEPQNVAVAPDGKEVYVSNTASGTVSVIMAMGERSCVVATIEVGTEPYGMALTPNGKKLYVANARSNDVSVIDTKKDRVVDTIDDVGLEPRGVAITNDGDGDDRDEKVYVTQFLGVDRPGVTIGRDDYKEGRITVISTATDQVIGEVVLNPIDDTGFKSLGSALGHRPATESVITQASPNMLNSVAIKGGRAYVPNTAASADGPVAFNVNVQALLSVIDAGTDAESRPQTINMNRGINFEPAATKLFLGVPWAIAFKHRSNEGYVVAAAANVVVKVDLDGSGTPTIHAPTGAGQQSGIIRIPVGQNPRGIAINGRDDRAYVMNEVSRDLSVIDLSTHQVIATVPTADLPAPGTEEAKIQIGKAVFNSSTGVNLRQLGPDGVVGPVLSKDGWSGCFSCHPFGLTDGIVWIFASGPRRTLPLNGTFNPRNPNDIKILNHSAIFDEIQDFELNIRNISGGTGLIKLANGGQDPDVKPLVPRANAHRDSTLEALAEFVARGIRSPIAPLPAHGHRGHDRDRGGDLNGDRDAERDANRKDVMRGRRLFASANCAHCHGGGGWASSRRTFDPPPLATEFNMKGELFHFLQQVDTFNSADSNEIRAPLGVETALGENGFNPPSLLGAFALGPYLHNGKAQTLAQVMENVTHRSAGTRGVDLLSDPRDLQRLVGFLESIDASTEPFDPSAALEPGTIAGETAAAVASGLDLRLDLIGGNPAGPRAELAYTVPAAARVELAMYDVQGRRVATVVSGVKAAGRYRLSWDGRRDDGTAARAGVYFARLESPAGLRVRKLVLAR